MNRRRTALSVSLVALAAAPLLAACGSAPHPGAAAVVDGDRITVTQLQGRVKAIRAAQERSPQAAQLVQNTGRLSLATLNSMIFDRVLRRGAEDAGVTVSRGDVQEWRSIAEKRAGGAEKLREMWIQQAIAPGEIDSVVRNQLLLDGLSRSLGVDRQQPQGQQRLAEALSETSRKMGIDVNPRFGKWNDQQIILGGTKEPWIADASRSAQKQPA